MDPGTVRGAPHSEWERAVRAIHFKETSTLWARVLRASLVKPLAFLGSLLVMKVASQSSLS